MMKVEELMKVGYEKKVSLRNSIELILKKKKGFALNVEDVMKELNYKSEEDYKKVRNALSNLVRDEKIHKRYTNEGVNYFI